MEFLVEQTGATRDKALWQRLNRILLLLIQLLVLILIALALAGPLAELPQTGPAENTVTVLIVSDYLAPPDEITEGVMTLADHEVIMTHVIAPGRNRPASRRRNDY